jgi:hypothetical protein
MLFRAVLRFRIKKRIHMDLNPGKRMPSSYPVLRALWRREAATKRWRPGRTAGSQLCPAYRSRGCTPPPPHPHSPPAAVHFNRYQIVKGQGGQLTVSCVQRTAAKAAYLLLPTHTVHLQQYTSSIRVPDPDPQQSDKLDPDPD